VSDRQADRHDGRPSGRPDERDGTHPASKQRARESSLETSGPPAGSTLACAGLDQSRPAVAGTAQETTVLRSCVDLVERFALFRDAQGRQELAVSLEAPGFDGLELSVVRLGDRRIGLRFKKLRANAVDRDALDDLVRRLEARGLSVADVECDEDESGRGG
jgi:hypothetical protein